jgi:hypothetical protein
MPNPCRRRTGESTRNANWFRYCITDGATYYIWTNLVIYLSTLRILVEKCSILGQQSRVVDPEVFIPHPTSEKFRIQIRIQTIFSTVFKLKMLYKILPFYCQKQHCCPESCHLNFWFFTWEILNCSCENRTFHSKFGSGSAKAKVSGSDRIRILNTVTNFDNLSSTFECMSHIFLPFWMGYNLFVVPYVPPCKIYCPGISVVQLFLKILFCSFCQSSDYTHW